MIKAIVAAPVPATDNAVGGGIGTWVNILKKYTKKHPDELGVLFINTIPVANATTGRSLWQRVIVQGFKMLKLNSQLKKMIAKEKPDVLHITTSGELATIRDILFMRTAKKYKIPTVYHLHFGRVAEISHTNTNEWKLIKRAICMADAIISLDKSTEKAILEKIPASKVITTPNPISVFDVRHDQAIQSKHSIMYLGWMVKTKGIDELIEAWYSLSKEFPEYTLDLVGNGDPDYISSLKERSSDSVVFHGEKSHWEAMKLLSECEMFILPSYTEGFPNVILEAMALSKPIIATSVGAISDMLSGECGVVIPPKSSESIVTAVESLVDDNEKRKTIANNAYNKVKREYNTDVVMKKYMSIWTKVLDIKQ